MIRINLIGKPHAGAGAGRGNIGKILGIVAAAVMVVVAGGVLWTFRAALIPAAPPQQKQEPVAQKEPASSAPAGPGMLAEVVREVREEGSGVAAGPVAESSYNDLSFDQRIAYEVLFAKNVLELMDRAVPAGVGIRTLEADNFQTVYAVGLAPSRALVEGLFASLKAGNVSLLPRPLTQIAPNGGDSYRFAVTGRVRFGPDPAAGISLPLNGDLPRALQAFEKAARENSISIVKKPSKASTEKVGGCCRYLYQWSGTGSYRNFSRFVDQLCQTRQAFAFKRISLTAASGPHVTIESQVIVTTRE
jgi:hypothetical protein